MNNPEEVVHDNKAFLFRRVILNIEEDRIIPALYSGFTYARAVGDTAAEARIMRYIQDGALIRRLGFLDNLKRDPATAVEYYDEDRNNDPYAYDVATEGELIKVRLLLLEFLALHAEEEGINFDDLMNKLK